MSNIKDTAEAIKGIVEAVPIYEDALQPAMKELSKGTLTIAKAVNVALAPVSLLVWGYEQIKGYLETSLPKKLENTPSENIQPPDPSIAVPTIEALRYTGQKEELREMFTTLIANSMDKKYDSSIHPSFVEIIKQLNSDEAKILKLLSHFSVIPIIDVQGILRENPTKFASTLKDFSLLPYEANCEFPENGPSYIGNLKRLGLIEVSYDFYANDVFSYNELVNHPTIIEEKRILEYGEYNIDIKKGGIKRTKFGGMFYNSCVQDK
ncbi:DUF4393 domain-containing protein [Cytobacillus oceanisediminis]|uniref:DUF4393 domain-containing protein n=1 Tax=Cytobacillus oceanisediminis TaxID=665099 RepID=UPI001CCAD0A9|nr:DUF4393 domain-containing protein [Cytobacillus oceanisediminis]MBZ9537222.1 DUF4393 domain-containing protein [Cytobacillus oceanisediminis]